MKITRHVLYTWVDIHNNGYKLYSQVYSDTMEPNLGWVLATPTAAIESHT